MIKNKILEEKGKIVIIACEVCGKGIEKRKTVIEHAKKDPKPSYSCCKECWKTEKGKNLKLTRMRATSKERYGVENIFEDKDYIKKKTKEKLGVENVFLLEKVQEKIKQDLQIIEENGRTKASNRAIKGLETRKILYGEDIQGCIRKSSIEETCLERYGASQFFASEEGRITKEFFTKKYGEEEGGKRWEAKKKASGITKEKMIEKYGEEEGIFKYNNWKQKVKQNKENFIVRWGEKEGIKKYKKWVDEFLKRTRNFSISKQEIKFFDALEKRIGLPINRQVNTFHRSWDGSIKNKILLEYQGTYWHADPRVYSEDFIFKIKGSKDISAKEIWRKDEMKKDLVEKNKLFYITVWEIDCINNFEKEVEKIARRVYDILKLR